MKTKTTLRYQACILPKAASPLDPTPPSLALKQLATLLDRMSVNGGCVTVNGGALPLQTFAGVPSPVAGRVTSDIDV